MSNPGQASQTSLALAAAAIIGARWATDGGQRDDADQRVSGPGPVPAGAAPLDAAALWGPEPVEVPAPALVALPEVAEVPEALFSPWGPPVTADIPPPPTDNLFSHAIPSPRQTEPPAPPATARGGEGYGLGSVMGDLPFPEPFDAGALEPAPFFDYDREAAPAYAGAGVGGTAPGGGGPLPRRVPQVPDIPDSFLSYSEVFYADEADGVELDRIKTFLSHPTGATDLRTAGLDVAAVLEAVRAIPHVRDAQIAGQESGQTLRVEFVDGVDEAQIIQEIARVLREKMGLAAAPSSEPTLHVPGRQRIAARVPVRTAPGAVLAAPARPGPLPRPTLPATRLALEHVQVTMVGTEAMVEVRLAHGRGVATGTAQGPAVDGYLLRLAAGATGDAIDKLSESRTRLYIEHVGLQQFAGVEVAVVVVLLTHDSATEQLSGSAIVSGDLRQAAVRATLQAVNRRLESLLA